MGWFHEMNLKRKVAGALSTMPIRELSAAVIANEVSASEAEVAALLDAMQQRGLVAVRREGSLELFRMNRDNGTIAKIMDHLGPDAPEPNGITLRPHEDGSWTAELAEPAGMLVRGSTREEALERAKALSERMASLSKPL